MDNLRLQQFGELVHEQDIEPTAAALLVLAGVLEDKLPQHGQLRELVEHFTGLLRS